MASILDLVKHYQHAIEKYQNDEQKVLNCINKLYELGVTVQHLQETGVGRTVNALRKEPGDVGQAARALVYKWKVMVAAEESDQEGDHNNDTTSYNGHEHGKDYHNNTSESQSRPDKEKPQYDKKHKTEEKDYKHTNGDYNRSKKKYHSSEEEEPDIKKTKYSNTKDNGYTKHTEIKVKVEPAGSDVDSQDETSQSESDSDDSQSSEEDIKPDVKVKLENIKIEKNKTTKHSSHSGYEKPKHESSFEKSKEHSEKHHKHSRSEGRHSSPSEKSSKEKEKQYIHKSSKEHDRDVDKREKDQRSDKKEKTKRDESIDKHGLKSNPEKNRSNTSSDKHKSNSEKHISSDTTEKHKSSNSSEKHRSSSSSEKHKSSSSSEKYKSSSSSSEKHKTSSSEKHKSHSEKNSSKSDKHINKSDRDKHKSSTEKEISNDKQTSKENISSSSSKDKHSSVKDTSKEKKTSSKEKDHNHKSDKTHSSKETDSKSKDSKRRSESYTDDSNSKKSKHKSSSSSSKSSSSKSKDNVPKKTQVSGEDSDDGIDCGSGASFAEALGMISPAKPKKKSMARDITQSPPSSSEDLSPATLLAPSAKLAPLPALEISALPEISPHYRPRPPPKFLPHFTDEDAISAGISSKNQRTKVYSGNKVIGKIPTLYEMCVHILQEHIDALEYTGGVPYEILKPVVDKATPQQLSLLEHYNPYLMDDTDHLWQKFCEKHFRNKKRQEMETWREMFMRCQEEQEIRLKSLTANIRIAQEAKKAPIKQTKMAYVDSVVKPPRNIAKKQAQHGTAFAATASPAARVASLSAAPNVLKGGRATAPVTIPSSSALKPKKAPLMQKALQFMRGRKR